MFFSGNTPLPSYGRCAFDMSQRNAHLSIELIEFSDRAEAISLAAQIATIETYDEENDLRKILKNLQASGVKITSSASGNTLTINLKFRVEKMS